MAVVLLLLCIGVNEGLNIYTHHGESITIPDVRQHSFQSSVAALEDLGMEVVVNDTGYVKHLPPGTVLDMLPAPGTKVKSGHVVYLTINASQSPTLVLPDIIDNCSLREAMAKLQAKGFKLGTPQEVPGEKDWVYGILVDNHHVAAGDHISIESTLIIQVGNGQRDARDSIYMTDVPTVEYDDLDDFYDMEPSSEPVDVGTGDDFEVIE